MKNEYDYLNDVKMDFSVYNEEVLTEEEVYKMSELKRKNKNIKKRLAIVGAAAVLTVATGVAASEGYIDRIIKTISLGHSVIMQTDHNSPHSLPDELIGKLYDSNGNVLTALRDSDFNSIYDKNGKLLSQEELMKMFNEALGDNVNINDADAAQMSYDTVEKAQNDVLFDIKSPLYMPNGYEFERAYTYKDNNGNISGYYITLEYKNAEDKIISVSERLLNEETAFEISTDGNIEEMTINGRKTAIIDDRTAGFETEDNVSINIATKGNVSKDELIRIAESME